MNLLCVYSALVNPRRRSIPSALREYEQNMCARSVEKVLKSRQAALLLHSAAVLSPADITRAQAAASASSIAAIYPNASFEPLE